MDKFLTRKKKSVRTLINHSLVRGKLVQCGVEYVEDIYLNGIHADFFLPSPSTGFDGDSLILAGWFIKMIEFHGIQRLLEVIGVVAVYGVFKKMTTGN